MAYGAGATYSDNVTALAINMYVDDARIIEQSMKSYPLLWMLLGDKDPVQNLDGTGTKLDFKNSKYDSGAKIEMIINGAVITPVALTNPFAAVNPTPYTGPLAVTFDWYEGVAGTDISGKDLRRIKGKEKKGQELLVGVGQSLTTGRLDQWSTMVYNNVAPGTTNIGGLPYIIDADTPYGLTRTDAGNVFFDGLSRSGGVVSASTIQADVRAVNDNGGQGDLVVMNTLLINKLGDEFQNVSQIVDPNPKISGLRSMYYRVGNTTIISDPKAPVNTTPDPDQYEYYVLSTDTWRTYFKMYEETADGYNDISPRTSTVELMRRPDLLDAFRISQIHAGQVLCNRPNRNLKRSAVTTS